MIDGEVKSAIEIEAEVYYRDDEKKRNVHAETMQRSTSFRRNEVVAGEVPDLEAAGGTES